MENNRNQNPSALMITYMGYIGVHEYHPTHKTFMGRVINVGTAKISFSGSTPEELRNEMSAGIEEYLALCRETLTEPDVPLPMP